MIALGGWWLVAELAKPQTRISCWGFASSAASHTLATSSRNQTSSAGSPR